MYSRKFGARLRGMLGKPRISRMDSLAGVRRGGRPTIGCSVRHAGPSNRGKPYPLVSALFGQSVVKFTSVLGEKLLGFTAASLCKVLGSGGHFATDRTLDRG